MLKGFNIRFGQAEIKSANLKIGLLKLSSLKSRKGKKMKSIESKGPVGHHQADQHMHCGNSRRRRMRERAEKIFEDIITKNFPNLMKNMNLQI